MICTISLPKCRTWPHLTTPKLKTVFTGEEMENQPSNVPDFRVNEKHPSARRPVTPPPRGTPNQTFGPVFWLAFILLQRLPMRLRRTVAFCRSRQAYSSGGLHRNVCLSRVTGFPFHPLRDHGARNPKRADYTPLSGFYQCRKCTATTAVAPAISSARRPGRRRRARAAAPSPDLHPTSQSFPC